MTLILSASPNMMHFVRAFSSYACLRRKAFCYRGGSKLWKNCIVHQKHFPNRWWEEAYPASYPPRSATGYKLQKPSKESGIFQSLGTFNFVNFLLKDKVKRREPGGGWHNAPLNTLLTALHLFHDMIIIGKESSLAISAI